MPAEARATRELLWTATLVGAVAGLFLVGGLARFTSRERFRRLSLPLTVVSAAFWATLYTWAFWTWWDSCYGYLYPDWVRWVWPPYGLVTGAGLAVLFWWLALRIPGHPVLNLAILGGLHSLPGHAWAIYGKGLLEKCPILQGVEPAPALVFGFFEFIMYWSFVLALALLLRFAVDRLRPAPCGG